MVKREERAPILGLASECKVPAIAVWFDTPLDVCLARNRGRPADEVADEGGLRNVHAALEAPAADEGFVDVWRVESDALLPI